MNRARCIQRRGKGSLDVNGQPQPQDATLDAGSVAAADAVRAAMRFCRVLRHRKSYVILSLAIACLLGAYYYFTATRIYKASASILVSQTGSDAWSTAMASGGGVDTFLLTNEKLFSSAVVLEGAAKELAKLPSNMRVDLADVPRENWLDTLRSNLSAQVVRRTNVIELTCRSKSPEAATATVEAVVKSYMTFVDKDPQGRVRRIGGDSRSRTQENGGEARESQERLLEIKRRAGIVIREGAEIVHPVVQRVIELNKTLVEVQQDRLQLEASLAAIHAAIRNGGDLREHLVAVDPTVGRELIMTALGINPQFAEVAGQVERELLDDHAKLQALRRHLRPDPSPDPATGTEYPELRTVPGRVSGKRQSTGSSNPTAATRPDARVHGGRKARQGSGTREETRRVLR